MLDASTVARRKAHRGVAQAAKLCSISRKISPILTTNARMLATRNRQTSPALRELQMRARESALRVAQRIPEPHQARMVLKSALRRAAAGRPPIARPSAQLDPFRWQHDCSSRYSILREGRVLQRLPGVDPWAAAGVLPRHGVVSFKVVVERAKTGLDGPGAKPRVCVGVCDAANTVAWGLHVQSGRLLRWTRDAETGQVSAGDGFDGDARWPNGNGMRVMQADGKKSTGGLTVECVLDADAGALIFGVNGGEQRHALPAGSLPHGRELRPWVRLVCADDQVRLEPGGNDRGIGGRGHLQHGRGSSSMRSRKNRRGRTTGRPGTGGVATGAAAQSPQKGRRVDHH